jgi:acetyltransferase-like isoleucine patch superfamily enzyme
LSRIPDLIRRRLQPVQLGRRIGESFIGKDVAIGPGILIELGAFVQGLDTGLTKFGAVIGDGADIGCGCVLNPGSIIGRRSVLYPNTLWRGVCPPGVIVKLRQSQEIVELHPRIG